MAEVSRSYSVVPFMLVSCQLPLSSSTELPVAKSRGDVYVSLCTPKTPRATGPLEHRNEEHHWGILVAYRISGTLPFSFNFVDPVRLLRTRGPALRVSAVVDLNYNYKKHDHAWPCVQLGASNGHCMRQDPW